MNNKYKYKFGIRKEKAWAWHVGLFFCVHPKSDIDNKREIYLFLCFGRTDITIGFFHEDDMDVEF